MPSLSVPQGRWLRVVLMGAGAISGLLLLSALIITGKVRLAVAFVTGVVLVALAVKDIRLAIVATLAYLVVMGDLRRLLIPVAGWSGADPLLIVGPGFAILLTAYLFASRTARFDTTLAPWILGLMAIMGLQILNPRQGGLMVGVAGALFYVVPLLWYWIGQTYATPEFIETALYRVVVPLGFLAAALGLYQVFFGYLPYQQTWFQCCGYTALGVSGIQAPISLFASSIEYAVFTVVVCMILWSRFLLKQDTAALLGLLPLFAAALLQGSRGPIAKCMVVAAALWAALGTDRRTWVLRGAIAVAVGGLGLVVMLTQVEGASAVQDNRRVEHRLQRQARGFTDPGNSTAGTHLGMMLSGVVDGVKRPLGEGLGSTTLAAQKFGSDSSPKGSTEVDISNMFVSNGLIGGLIFLAIVFITIKQSIQYWSQSRSLVALCIAGTLGITLLNWLAPGRYALTPFVWFLIGSLDRLYARERSDPTFNPT
jgi:hypothetical protein